MALSALMGLLITLLPFFRSTIRTSGEALPSACCRTQTKLSDSSVQELKPIDAGYPRHQHMFCFEVIVARHVLGSEASDLLTWIPQEVKETSSVNLIGREAILSWLQRSARVLVTFPLGTRVSEVYRANLQLAM
jgi:hypothetical protein